MSIKVMSRVWDKSKQKGTNRVALLAIADHADDYGVAWPGLELIAKKALIKKRQVINVIERLEASGELIVIHNRGRHISNRYFVTVGLSPDEIKTTLDTHDELQTDDDEAIEKGATDCTLSTRNSAIYFTFSRRKGAKDYTITNEEKVQYSEEKVQSRTKKVQFSTQKGAIAIAPEPSIEPSENHQEEPPPSPKQKPNGKSPKPIGDLLKTQRQQVDDLREALCDLCKIHKDCEIATPKQVEDVKEAMKRLRPQDATAKEVSKDFKAYWYSQDWRGQKGQPPTPMNVCELWPRFRGAKLNGSQMRKLSDDKLEAYKRMEQERMEAEG